MDRIDVVHDAGRLLSRILPSHEMRRASYSPWEQGHEGVKTGKAPETDRHGIIQSSGVAMASNEDFFQVFGHISVFFATLDFFVTAIITRMVRPENIALRRLERATLGQKLQYLADLHEEETFHPEICKRVQKAIPAALTIAELRNRFIHDLWKFAPDDVAQGVLERLNLRPGQKGAVVTFDFCKERYSLEQMYDLLKDIGRLQHTFAAFLDELPGPHGFE